MSDYWRCCACNETWRFIRICLKIVNITDGSALYYATLPRILWTWCKIWDKWHDGLSFECHYSYFALFYATIILCPRVCVLIKIHRAVLVVAFKCAQTLRQTLHSPRFHTKIHWTHKKKLKEKMNKWSTMWFD